MNRFTELEINTAILNKLVSRKMIKGTPHPKFWILLDGVKAVKVKIPNPHNRPFNNRKSEAIADALKINMEEFSLLIECTLTGPKYMEMLKSRL